MDTNVLIYREDNSVIQESIIELLRDINDISELKIIIHPASLDDLKKDKNIGRRNIIISKIKTYASLESYPSPDKDYAFLSKYHGNKKPNDLIDALLLYSVFKDAVDLLITEDRGIHRKAKRFGLEDRILTIDDATSLLKKYIIQNDLISPPALKNDFVFNLNIEDPIFDDIKADYPTFREWFIKRKREGRPCWVHFKEDNSIGAILIYKIEDEAIPSIPPMMKMRRFKICTFKVSHYGYKIGELLIKLSIDYSIKHNIQEIYLTHYKKDEDFLIDLISEYGFVRKASFPDGEDIYIKNLIPNKTILADLLPTDLGTKYYPIFYDGELVKKFITPILPRFHNLLFTDHLPRQMSLIECGGDFIAEGNAIKKAYLSHSNIKNLNRGDILLFYISRPIKKLASLGVVEAIYPNIDNIDVIQRLVAKRTVYSIQEIRDMKKPLLIILFRHHFHLKNPIPLRSLIEEGIIPNAPVSIRQISNGSYIRIKEKGKIDGRYTID
jgi:hypothetical protein